MHHVAGRHQDWIREQDQDQANRRSNDRGMGYRLADTMRHSSERGSGMVFHLVLASHALAMPAHPANRYDMVRLSGN